MRWGLLALALLLIPLASAATIRGVIYTEELTIAENVILTISTSPQLRVLVPDGAYEVELPPGKYALAITQLGTNITLTEQLTVAQEGIFTHDIFLLPDLTEEDELYDELVGDFESPPEDFTAADGSSDLSSRLIVGALLIIVIGGAGHWALRHSRKKRSTQTKRVKEETVPDEYLERGESEPHRLRARGERQDREDQEGPREHPCAEEIICAAVSTVLTALLGSKYYEFWMDSLAGDKVTPLPDFGASPKSTPQSFAHIEAVCLGCTLWNAVAFRARENIVFAERGKNRMNPPRPKERGIPPSSSRTAEI